MPASLLPYTEILVGVALLAACYFLFAPLKSYAAASGAKQDGKVFNLDEFLLIGWIVLASVGVCLVLYGLVG